MKNGAVSCACKIQVFKVFCIILAHPVASQHCPCQSVRTKMSTWVKLWGNLPTYFSRSNTISQFVPKNCMTFHDISDLVVCFAT